MSMKRIMAAAMAGLMCASILAGCGGSKTSAGTAANGGSAASVKETKGELTYILATRSEFQTSLSDAMIAAGTELGYDITIQNGDSDVAKQLQYVETCRNAGQKAVMIQMVDADTAQTLVDAAGDMNVVFVNCPPSDMSVCAADNVAYVGSDEDEAGKMQGEFLANYFKAKGQTDVKYIMLQGQLGYVATLKRTAGAIKAMNDNGLNATEATAPLVCDFDRPTAQENVAPLMSSGLDFDCIIANNDAMALGAIEAAKAANKPLDFPVCGIDCTADGGQAIVNGTMAMTVFQNPVGQGKGALVAALNLIEGNAINTGMEEFSLDDSGEDWSEHVMWIPFEPVTADNVADYM